MKRCLLLTLAVAACAGIIGWAAAPDDTNTLPIAKIAESGGVAVATAAKGTKPSIVLVRTRSEALGDGRVLAAELVLVNPLDVPITYHGYTMDSWATRPPVGEIHPLYSRQVKDGDEWKDSSIGWCGTGAAEMTVPPGHAGRFAASIVLPAKTARAGVRCQWTGPGEKKETLVLWSSDIKPE